VLNRAVWTLLNIGAAIFCAEIACEIIECTPRTTAVDSSSCLCFGLIRCVPVPKLTKGKPISLSGQTYPLFPRSNCREKEECLMTKTFLLALSLLVSTAWLCAQSQYPQTGSSQTGTTASEQTTVKGCLQGSNGNYTLMADNGTTYQLQGDTSKLSSHVGHEIQVTGSTMSTAAGSSSTSTQSSGTQQSTLTVQSFKHISKSCTSASKSKY
jgi:hypothetical protein